MADTEVIRMRKDINLLSACSIMTGIIIGSGIFVSPASLITNCGSVGMTLVMWMLSGLLSLGVALCFTELASIYPKAGGDYTFFKEILGPLPGFINVWQNFALAQPSFQALLAITTTDYLVQSIIPNICYIPDIAARLFTIWIIVTIVALNSVYVRYVASVQIVLTFIKIVALVGIIVIGMTELAMGRTEILSQGFLGTNTSFGAHAIAVNSGIFTYMGWQYIFCLMEEVKEPKRIVPQATIISMITVTVLYTLTNVAYFTVMTPEEMMSSKAVALTFAEKTIGKFSVVVPFFVACSTIGSLNGAILGGSRIYFAAARDNLFPNIMAAIHVKYRTPWVSLFSVTAVSTLYILTGEAISILEFLGFLATLTLALTTYCLLYLRWKQPNLVRPVKIPLAIAILCFVVLVALLLLGVYQAPYRNGITILVAATGVPIYCIFVIWAGRQRTCIAKIEKWNCVLQKFLLVVHPERDD